MAAYANLLESLSKLSIKTNTFVHEPATDNESWAKLLLEADALATKTLILKPKTAKSAATVPLVVIALESTETDVTALSKDLGLKNCRFATEDLITEFFGVEKEAVSPFVLSNLSEGQSVHLAVDQALLNVEADKKLAFRTGAGEKSLLVAGGDLKVFLGSLGVEQKVIDFAALKTSSDEKPAAKESAKKAAPTKAVAADAEEAEATHQMGIEYKKHADFPNWYQQVVTKSEMLDYYSVSGCYILRPLAYNVWKEITNFFDNAINEMGVEDVYFPMFVPHSVLEKEKDHIEGFAPEVAWVTRAGETDLEEPIAIRPTSETVIYPYFSKWIRTHRDLPFRINQWCSVVRWEFKNPQPFLRTREFLWQEGHTAHVDKESAGKEVLEILDLYEKVYTDYLALPVVKGEKSLKERFAGGLYTTTVEGFVPAVGRAIQGGTSHCLGQNFSKMFNITVQDPTDETKKIHVWQNSWGLSTRTIGVMVMVHGDDKGLVLPPRVALIQTVVVPCGITARTAHADSEALYDECDRVARQLKKAGLKTKADVRPNYTPGFKYNYWELRGVPIRIEIGPKELKEGKVTCIRRDTGERSTVMMDHLEQGVKDLLETIQREMYERAKAQMDDSIVRVMKWDDFVPTLNAKKLCLIPWCDRTECEDSIKDNSKRVTEDDAPEDDRAPSMGAKSLCKPFAQPTNEPIVPGVTKCVACGQDAKHYMLFGRSY